MNEVDQKKRMLLTGIIATVILFVIVLVVLFILMGIDSQKTKIVYKDLTYKTKTTEITTEQGVYQQSSIEYNGKSLPIILIAPDQKTYYCIESLAALAGYKYNKGIYTETDTLDESKEKCHIDNGGEYVNFIKDTNTISKYIKVTEEYEAELKLVGAAKKEAYIEAETEDEEVFSVEDNIIQFADEKLYAPLDAITKGLNMGIANEGSMIYIYTIEDLVANYTEVLSSQGYTLTPNFRNQRGLYDGLAVVGKNEKYGVVKINNGNYEELISAKYDSVEYIQSIGEFIISSNGKFGMIKPGEEKPTIALQYDSITLMDATKKLYIVQLNSKYGVINSDGKEVIPTEYDQIGLNDSVTYSAQGLKSKYVIADKCIPVVKNNLYGMYNIDGNCLIPTKYTSIGCADPAKLISDTRAMPTITVPLSEEVTAIVFSAQNAVGITSYGLISTDGEVIQNTYYTAIYYMVNNGKTTYYFNKLDHELLTLKEYINGSTVAREYIENHKPLTEKDYKEKAEEEQANLEKLNNASSDDNVEENNAEENNDEEITNQNEEENNDEE
ncbi:MAG: WG repeat-containing protein [Bacilli bacterium]